MSPRRVLVLAPDLFFAARIDATARALGVTLRETSVAGALDACRAEPPDLVIVDLHGAGDPLAAVRALKSDPATRAIAIVGFYAHVDQALRERALAAGADRVMPRSAFSMKLAEILAGTEG